MKIFSISAAAALLGSVAANSSTSHSSSSRLMNGDFSLLLNKVVDTSNSNLYFMGWTDTVFECQAMCAADPRCQAYQWSSNECNGITNAFPFVTEPQEGTYCGHRRGEHARQCRTNFLVFYDFDMVTPAITSNSPSLIQFGLQDSEVDCQLRCMKRADCLAYSYFSTTQLCYGLDTVTKVMISDNNANSGRKTRLCLAAPLDGSYTSSSSTSVSSSLWKTISSSDFSSTHYDTTSTSTTSRTSSHSTSTSSKHKKSSKKSSSSSSSSSKMIKKVRKVKVKRRRSESLRAH